MVRAVGPSLHVFLTAALHESRFEKQARSLIDAGEATEVHLAARWHAGLPREQEVASGVHVHRISLWTSRLGTGIASQVIKGLEFRSRLLSLARRLQPAVVVAHSLPALAPAAAAAAATGAPLVYDAHELETERNGLRGLRQRFDRQLERALISRCAGVSVVSDAIADWYRERYDIERPTVVRNVPVVSAPKLDLGPNPLRQRIGVGADACLFLYQGGFFRGRRLEQFVRVFQAERGHRHLVLLGYGELEAELRAAASASPNIHVVPAVPPREVLAYTADADVGLVGVDDVCLSYRYSLPNKLFEYLAAGLPVIAPRFPEIESFVTRFGCGRVVEADDASWAAAIRAVPPDWRGELAAAVQRAASSVSWEAEGARFVAMHRSARMGRG